MVIKKIKIAIIEDEADILDVIDYNLSKEGYEVYSASDGLNGLDLIYSLYIYLHSSLLGFKHQPNI